MTEKTALQLKQRKIAVSAEKIKIKAGVSCYGAARAERIGKKWTSPWMKQLDKTKRIIPHQLEREIQIEWERGEEVENISQTETIRRFKIKRNWKATYKYKFGI